MTPAQLAQFERDMLVHAGNSDREAAHSNADEILVRFIRELGYDLLADLYERVGKWYA